MTRFRLAVLALVSVLSAGLGAGTALSEPPPKPAPAPAAAPAAAPTPPPKAEEPDPLGVACAPGVDSRTSDLCAQWKAADAATRSARWTVTGFWLQAAAAVAGLFTLIAAGFAAFYAKRAADAARDSVTVAREELLAARKSSERQLRAYVVVSDFQVEDLVVGKEPQFTYEIKNCGQTPAKNVRVKNVLLFLPPDRIRTDDLVALSRMDLGPSQKSSQYIQTEILTRAVHDRLMRRELVYVVSVYVSYKDAFGRTRRTIERARLEPHALNEKGAGGLDLDDRNSRSS